MKTKVKTKKCAVCDEPFIPWYTTLQPTCSIKCTIKYNEEKEITKRFEKLKVEVQGTALLEKAARIVFQKFIRERDKHFPCISCGTKHSPQFDAGHYKKAEIFTGLIFEETNCHKQCCYCNGPIMHGNLDEYRKGLIARYGEDYVWELESIADANRVYSFSRHELIEIANTYKTKLRLLQANPKP